jgi:hypothetical protein
MRVGSTSLASRQGTNSDRGTMKMLPSGHTPVIEAIAGDPAASHATAAAAETR